MTSFIITMLLAAALDWPQFGGPNRNFKSEAKGLAAVWPAGGPKKLWARDLGDGYSAVAVDGGVLYTMYRQGTTEVVLAADANTGKTLWEKRSPAGFLPGMKMENGPGPHVTPLVTATTVYTAGILGNFQALERKTGKPLWSKDLFREFGGRPSDRGYASSPLAYKNAIIVQAGATVAALDAKSGAVVWKSGGFEPSPSSPLLIQLGGQDQLVVFSGDSVAGIDAAQGARLWSHPHRTDYGLNISVPIWGDDGILFITSAYSGGTRALQLARAAGKTTVRQLWFTNQMRIHHGNAVRIGDHVYGSSGDFGPAPFTAIDVKTGKIAWRSRGIAKASFVYADGKLILVDEDGNLALATLSPQGLNVISKAQLLRSNAWTAPSIAGTRLFVRDRRSLQAFDLR